MLPAGVTKGLLPPRHQRGQAAVYVYIFLAVLLISVGILYKAGKLTSNKMQVQNAADAAAYSASVIEARDLNFAAYMNRAIAANEVAIGQLVGLASWAYHWRSFGDFLNAYNNLFIGPATSGASTPIIQGISKGFTVPGNFFIKILKTLADVGTTVLHNTNKTYGWASYAYHITSIINVMGVFDEMVTRNGPTGAKLSDFGIMSLIFHMATYGALPLLPGQRFSEGYLPTKTAPLDDFKNGTAPYARLAGLIRESRDPFTKARGWELRPPGFPIDIKIGQDWTVNPKVLGVHIGRTGIVWEIRFHFDMSLERKGGSELRLVIPIKGNPSNIELAGQNFNWSSADTTTLAFELGGGFDLWAYLLGSQLGHIGANVSIANNQLVISYHLGPFSGNIPPTPMYFPTGAPFGAGFYQAGIKGKNKKERANLVYKQVLLDSLFGAGPVKDSDYGEAPKGSLAWMSPGVEGSPFPPLGVAASTLPPSDPKHRIKDKYGPLKSYAGLPPFVGVTGNDSFLGFGAPNLVIGVVQDEGDYDKGASGQPERESSGRFTLTEAMADQEIGAIAKSQVQFKRPTDIKAKYFWRADGDTEHGNTFNPYWQARLIETGYADRIIALLIQQKQDFIQLGQSAQLYFGSLKSYLQGLIP